MKKTLFLSAILGAALCGTAFAAVSTETVTKATVTVPGYTGAALSGKVNIVTSNLGGCQQDEISSNITAADYTVLAGNNTRFLIKGAKLDDAGTLVLAPSTVTGHTATNAAQLFIDAWGANAKVEVSNNMIIGASTYSEDGYNGAIRLSSRNDAAKGTLISGDVTMVDDVVITVSQDYNMITGSINGSGKTLTVQSSGSLTLAPADGKSIELGGLKHTGSGTLTVNGARMNGMIVNTAGTTNLNGSYTFDTDAAVLSRYDIKSATYTKENSAADGFISYNAGSTFYVIKGGTAGDGFSAENVTRDGSTNNYVLTLAEKSALTSVYAIGSTAHQLTSAVTEKAQSYIIENANTALTVTSGTFEHSKVTSNTRGNLTSLTLDGGNATITGDRVFDGNLTINAGSTLSMLSNDALQYGGSAESKTLTIKGTLAMDNHRLSIGNNWDGSTLAHYKIVMNGGTVTGAGDGKGALDFFNTSNLVATGESSIAAPIRVRNNKTLQIEVTEKSDTLTISGQLKQEGTNSKGAISLNGKGSLVIAAENAMTGGIVVNSGTLVARHDSALGANAVTVKNGATLEIAAGTTVSGFSSLSFETGASAVINGTLTMSNDDATISSVTLGSGATLTLGATNSDANNLTTSSLTVAGDATLNANLVVSAGGTMDFSSGATLTMGCTVEIGDDVTVIVSSEVQEYINRGEAMIIMYGVDNATLESITMGNVHFIMNGVERPDFFFVTEEDTVYGGKKLMVAPEPATATLSLLALAALAARRKRK